MRRRDGQVDVSLGELTRKVAELHLMTENGFREIERRIDSDLVPRDVYAVEAGERDRRIQHVQRSLNRFYGFAAAIAVAVLGAGISAAGALVVALVFATRHH